MKMKKILLILILITPFIVQSQTNIPFPGFFSEITDVTSQGGGLYDVTVSVNDQSGQYNGNAIDTVDFVLWQNCGRYEIDSILLQFPSQLIVRINDVDGSGAPVNGFSTVLEESPVLGVGFFISGILDSRNQCMLSYYAERLDVPGGGSEVAGVFYHFISFGQTYNLPEDTIKKYPRIVIYGTSGTLNLPDLDLAENSTYNGHKIELRVGTENTGTFYVTSIDSASIITSDCINQDYSKNGNDTINFYKPTLVTYHLIANDDYVRFCDEIDLYFDNTILEDGDTIPSIDCNTERFTSPFDFNDRVVVSNLTLADFEQLNVYVNGVFYNSSAYSISSDSLIFSSYTIGPSDEIFIEECNTGVSNPNSVTLNNVLSNSNNGGGLLIKNIGDPVDPQDAVTLSYLENFQDSVYRYSSSNGSTSAHITANGAGITITENSGSGEVTISIPEGVEPYYINLFMPASVTDGGAYHIVLDYTGDRGYNGTKNDLNIPLVRTGLDNYASASRANPANISENGGNSANTVTYGVSAFGGGDGSDLTMSLINFSLGINQMCRLDFNAIK
jgi:hypothetical protein